jgi:hypothetical protein
MKNKFLMYLAILNAVYALVAQSDFNAIVGIFCFAVYIALRNEEGKNGS